MERSSESRVRVRGKGASGEATNSPNVGGRRRVAWRGVAWRVRKPFHHIWYPPHSAPSTHLLGVGVDAAFMPPLQLHCPPLAVIILVVCELVGDVLLLRGIEVMAIHRNHRHDYRSTAQPGIRSWGRAVRQKLYKVACNVHNRSVPEQVYCQAARPIATTAASTTLLCTVLAALVSLRADRRLIGCFVDGTSEITAAKGQEAQHPHEHKPLEC